MALKSSNSKHKFWYKILSIVLLIGLLIFLYWFTYGALWKINNIEIVDILPSKYGGQLETTINGEDVSFEINGEDVSFLTV